MLEVGSTIGGLIIGELLGRGAMGEVYRADQVSLRRPVAVKRIAEHLIDDESVVGRFEREAQCIARVNSPHVLGVYEFGQFRDEAGNAHWLLVMELVEGGCNARELLREGLDWRQATSIVLQVAEGLSVAAEHGIVHRDIKPDNIMVNTKGVVKLADFGLAKSADSHGMTMEGALLGTPYYMPPEACQGEPIGPAGDLYSLGASWYHFLRGRPVFQYQNTMMILRAHAEEEPGPLSEVAPDVPKPIADLVHRCLSKKESDRPQSAEHLVQLIQALVADGITIPRTIPDVMQEAETLAPSTASTLKTSVAYSVSGEQTARSPDLRKSTLAAEIAGPEKVSGKSLPLIIGALIVVIGVLAGLIYALARPSSDTNRPHVEDERPLNQPVTSSQPPADDAEVIDAEIGQKISIETDAGPDDQLIEKAFVLSQQQLDESNPVAAFAQLKSISTLAATQVDWTSRYETMSEAIVQMARSQSSASLSQSMELMQKGQLNEALELLDHYKDVAELAGIGDRYQQVIETLHAKHVE